MPFFRSASSREAPAIIGVAFSSSANLRSSSFDGAHSEQTGAVVSGVVDERLARRKPSFWPTKIWNFRKEKKMEKQHMPATSEMTVRNNVPQRWKRIFQKLRYKGEHLRKPAARSDSGHTESGQKKRTDILSVHDRNKADVTNLDRQKQTHSVHPDSVSLHGRPMVTPLWVRRNARSPPPLDLNNLRVTGFRRMSRSHLKKKQK
ncbi:hypothetical protein KP509_20G038000 [Ceratopteris richardii]|uniref:Uncharacterized protein n=1 Tax=Ceratopteris richardii TaxID=49495 RepID=A0A8T2SGD6_CERRI|nr:hypothetical protein KP509_20G038000 [Ceratopteris richardii]